MTPEEKQKALAKFGRWCLDYFFVPPPGLVTKARELGLIDQTKREVEPDVGTLPRRKPTASLLGHRHDDTCTWSTDDGVWGTTCGNCFEFTTGGPRENKMEFCPYCGGALVVKEECGER